MAVYVWPSGLPVCPLAEGYSEGYPSNIIRSAMDTGPAQARRRQSRGVRVINVKYFLSEGQKNILDQFLSTLQDGVLPFDWTAPDGRALTVRIRPASEEQGLQYDLAIPGVSAADRYWQVSLTFEVMP